MSFPCLSTRRAVAPRCLLRLLCLPLLLLGPGLTACTPEPESAEPTSEAAAPIDTAPTGAEPAFDYPGGWLDDDTCVDICGVTPASPVERPPAVVCFDKEDAECAAKTGDGDFDYLMLSQHWLPSLCLGLDAGYDTTVTHQAGARCVADAPTRLTLHGLWPNYTAGFPQCCGSGQPLDPAAMNAWPEDLRARLWHAQPDPTVDAFEPAVCEIYDHEWQKHGTCFGESGDVDADAQAYFTFGLELFDRLEDANTQIDAWAGEATTRADLEALYPNSVQILCDRHHPERLLEVHTCWSRDGAMIDCAPTAGFGSLTACGEEVELPVWGG